MISPNIVEEQASSNDEKDNCSHYDSVQRSQKDSEIIQVDADGNARNLISTRPLSGVDKGRALAVTRGLIAALEVEVAELKKTTAALKVSQPTITMLMPNFAGRLHVMHYAGEAEDRAVHNVCRETARTPGSGV